MTRYTEILARLQSLRHGGDSDNSSDVPMGSSSPATSAADAAVQEHEANLAARATKNEPEGAANNSSTDSMTIMYKVAQPQPTLVLPPNYPFRTTETGYPIIRGRNYNQPRRASMSMTQGFMDPRITSFIESWAKAYTDMDNDPEGPGEGRFQLRLACKVRGLVTYGSRDKLVMRLVERALRDAARGWSEISDNVGRVKVEMAPGLPEVIPTLGMQVKGREEMEEMDEMDESLLVRV